MSSEVVSFNVFAQEGNFIGQFLWFIVVFVFHTYRRWREVAKWRVNWVWMDLSATCMNMAYYSSAPLKAGLTRGKTHLSHPTGLSGEFPHLFLFCEFNKLWILSSSGKTVLRTHSDTWEHKSSDRCQKRVCCLISGDDWGVRIRENSMFASTNLLNKTSSRWPSNWALALSLDKRDGVVNVPSRILPFCTNTDSFPCVTCEQVLYDVIVDPSILLQIEALDNELRTFHWSSEKRYFVGKKSGRSRHGKDTCFLEFVAWMLNVRSQLERFFICSPEGCSISSLWLKGAFWCIIDRTACLPKMLSAFLWGLRMNWILVQF